MNHPMGPIAVEDGQGDRPPARAGRGSAYLAFLWVLSRPTANVPPREHHQNRIDFLGDPEACGNPERLRVLPDNSPAVAAAQKGSTRQTPCALNPRPDAGGLQSPASGASCLGVLTSEDLSNAETRWRGGRSYRVNIHDHLQPSKTCCFSRGWSRCNRVETGRRPNCGDAAQPHSLARPKDSGLHDLGIPRRPQRQATQTSAAPVPCRLPSRRSRPHDLHPVQENRSCPPPGVEVLRYGWFTFRHLPDLLEQAVRQRRPRRRHKIHGSNDNLLFERQADLTITAAATGTLSSWSDFRHTLQNRVLVSERAAPKSQSFFRRRGGAVRISGCCFHINPGCSRRVRDRKKDQRFPNGGAVGISGPTPRINPRVLPSVRGRRFPIGGRGGQNLRDPSRDKPPGSALCTCGRNWLSHIGNPFGLRWKWTCALA